MHLTDFSLQQNGSSQSAVAMPQSDANSEELVVHLIDDDDEFRSVLQQQLSGFGFTVVAYRSAECFLAAYAPRPIECVILDVRMPGMTGIELQRVLRERRSAPVVLMLSAYAETPEIVRAVQQGAIDYLVKPVDEEVLIERVQTALAKDRESKRRSGDLLGRLRRISDREREVMELFIQAKTTIQIAHLLGISPKTVEKHRSQIYNKLEVNSIPELMRLVLQVPADA